VSFESLRADTVGEVELQGKVLVIKRVKQTFLLAAKESDRETIQRVALGLDDEASSGNESVLS